MCPTPKPRTPGGRPGKTLRYHMRSLALAAGCVAWSAIVGLIAAAYMDSIPGWVAVSLLVLALYGGLRYLLQQTTWSGLMMLPFSLLLLMSAPFLAWDGHWLGGACSGLFGILIVWYGIVMMKYRRQELREAREWESRHGTPAVLPCPVTTDQLVARLRAWAAAHPDTVSLNKKATRMACCDNAPDAYPYDTFILCRHGDDWCASFADLVNSPDTPCIPAPAVRRIFIRETGNIEPPLMDADVTPIQGLVFHHRGELRIYPAARADDFMQARGPALFTGNYVQCM